MSMKTCLCLMPLRWTCRWVERDTWSSGRSCDTDKMDTGFSVRDFVATLISSIPPQFFPLLPIYRHHQPRKIRGNIGVGVDIWLTHLFLNPDFILKCIPQSIPRFLQHIRVCRIIFILLCCYVWAGPVVALRCHIYHRFWEALSEFRLV